MTRLCKRLGMGWIVFLLLFGLFQKGWAEGQYRVKSGDTLYGISKSFGVSIHALRKANALEGDLLKPKQVLTIPSKRGEKGGGGECKSSSQKTINLPIKNVKEVSEETDSYTVQKGDSLSSISKKWRCSIEEIKRMNNLRTSNLKIGQVLVVPRIESRRDKEVEECGDGKENGETIEKEKTQGDAIAFSPLGKWNTPEERDLFVRVVKTFLGVPYKLGGSSLKGIDCSAFVKKIYEIFKVELPRTTQEQFSAGKKVEKDQLEEGDLVFFKRGENSTHVGIYIGDNQFVHASFRNQEVRIDHLNMPYFSNRFIKGVRVMELERES